MRRGDVFDAIGTDKDYAKTAKPEEIKSVKFVDGSKMYIEDKDLDIESRIIRPKRFAYQEATCTSGLKLRFYKQKYYYPYITTEKELRGIYER